MIVQASARNGWWKGFLCVVLLVVAAVGGIFFASPQRHVEMYEVQAVEVDGAAMLQTSKGRVEAAAAEGEEDSLLWSLRGMRLDAGAGELTESYEVVRQGDRFFELRVVRHFGWWSLFPALVAVVLCFVLREPIVALSGGIIAGALVMRMYDVTGDLVVPAIGTSSGATIIILYLWFLGGVMGLWSRTGAAAEFANWVTKNFVRGPRGAKFVTWLLGVLFFQGGTLSTVLVGTTVRPVADKQRVSHEELSYVVDSTASPIAVILPFNAWPIYVQTFLFVGGVPFLMTEADRIAFFFQCVPLYFYAWLAVGFTLLMCFDKLPFIGRAFKEAIKRSRETGELDRPGASPLLARELEEPDVPPGYRPHVLEFAVPILVLIGIAVGTFFGFGRPMVLWAFGTALLITFCAALLRGMSLADVMRGFGNGLKGVVYGSVVLLLAISVGAVSNETGAGVFLVELIGANLVYWVLPVALVLVTMVISFSTGTSFGTFAVTLPLGMPLAWAVAESGGLTNPELYLAVCFATMINGSVFGDQCSPISDTTVLSSMSTGCDLMDHVRTQIVPAMTAMGFAVCLWLAVCLIACRPV